MMRSLAVLLVLLAAAPVLAQPASPDAGRVYELSEVEVLPRPQNATEFVTALQQTYPPPLREAGVGGTVHISFVLSPTGEPGDVRVLSTPDSSFDAPTVQAVSLLRFTPAQVQGRPVAVRVEQPITWRVEAAPPAPPARTAPSQSEAAAPGNAEDGYELSAVDESPRLLNGRVFAQAMARQYPAPLRDAGTSGSVTVRFLVKEDGSTSEHTVTHSSHTAFNQPTLRAARVLRFRPARLNGRAVKVWVNQPVQWSVVGPSAMPPLYQPPQGRMTPPRNACSVTDC